MKNFCGIPKLDCLIIFPKDRDNFLGFAGIEDKEVAWWVELVGKNVIFFILFDLNHLHLASVRHMNLWSEVKQIVGGGGI